MHLPIFYIFLKKQDFFLKWLSNWPILQIAIIVNFIQDANGYIFIGKTAFGNILILLVKNSNYWQKNLLEGGGLPKDGGGGVKNADFEVTYCGLSISKGAHSKDPLSEFFNHSWLLSQVSNNFCTTVCTINISLLSKYFSYIPGSLTKSLWEHGIAYR